MPPALAIAGMISSGLLFLFLLKGLFKSRKNAAEVEVEITEKEQPAFFAFLRRLCADTGAPMPHRVFVVPDVNAAVAYRQSPLSLLVPTSKNLIVGLGLVNRLSVTEFKAVLAHEFGHFSQSSMKLGTYVCQANNIIADMVYGRDFFDDLLDRMRASDDRLELFVKCFTGLIWVLRKGLEGLFHVINFANSSLSRQMEFNADLVAVSVAGSDAIVHALARLDFANDAMMQTWQDLTDAGDHKLYSRDLFFHQARAAEHLKKVKREPNLGEVPALPDDPACTNQIFKPEDLGIPLMWATHPSNYDREQNAKRRYVRGITDERPSWVLFDNAADLRRRVTAHFYEIAQHVPADKLVEPETVQAFIDEEYAETTYPERFHGMYDDRYLDLTGREMWVPGLELRDPAALRAEYAQLYGPAVKAVMEKSRQIKEESRNVQEAVEQGKPCPFRGRRYDPVDGPGILEILDSELADNNRPLAAEDRKIFEVHLSMAEMLGGGQADELKTRYRFHGSVQEMRLKLENTAQAIAQVVEALSGQRQMSEERFRQVTGFFQEAHLTMKSTWDAANLLRIPKLRNMADGQCLGSFLLTEPLLSYLSNHVQDLDGKWIDRLENQLGEMLDRIQRMHFKSLGGILALQDQIATAWLAACEQRSEEGTAGRQDRVREHSGYDAMVGRRRS